MVEERAWLEVLKSVRVRLVAVVALVGTAVALAWPVAPSAAVVTWLDLIRPLAPGAPIGGDYTLSLPRRGEEHDIVFLARGVDPGSVIELHVVAKGQWSDAHETASFGIDCETPRSSAPDADRIRIKKALADVIAANDPGGLTVDAIPLAPSVAPKLTLALRGLAGMRGWLVALAIAIALVLIGALPRGGLWLGVATFAIALGLRIVNLDQPFLWDQDVQRLQIAASSLKEVLGGDGLKDRRPPGMFVLLHVVQVWGQAEWLVRLPAAIAGALTPPAIVLAVWRARGALTPLTSLAAAVAAFSPVLVSHSREVSEFALSGLLLCVLGGEVARAVERPMSRGALVRTAALFALCFWVSYLAALAIFACLGLLLLQRRIDRTLGRWLVGGVILGLPSLFLAYQALGRDMVAREVAAAQPGVAWGARSVGEITKALGGTLFDAVGSGLTLLAVVGLVHAIARRNTVAVIAGVMFVAVFAAVVLLTPIARVQPYYVVTALPLLLLVVAASDLPESGRLRAGVYGLVGLASVWFLARAAPSLSNLYVTEAGAFMQSFALDVRKSGQRRVVTVSKYDATLLSYYLARSEGVVLRSDAISHTDGELRVAGLEETIVPLLDTHFPNQDPAWVALTRLREQADLGSVLVVSRTEVRLPELDRALSRCELVRDAALASLLYCHARDVREP